MICSTIINYPCNNRNKCRNIWNLVTVICNLYKFWGFFINIFCFCFNNCCGWGLFEFFIIVLRVMSMISPFWMSHKLKTLTLCMSHLIAMITFISRLINTIIVLTLIRHSSVCNCCYSLICLEWLRNYLFPLIIIFKFY